MNVLLICQQSPATYPIPAYAFWRTYFVAGLQEAGHDVVEVPHVDWARGLLPLEPAARQKWLDETWSRTLAFAQSGVHIDLVLTYLYPQQVEPAAVGSLRQCGLPVVNFFCDNVREFRRVPAAFTKFDLHWVPEHNALALYHRAKLPHLYAPMPVWVPPCYRQPPAEETLPPAFIGSCDSSRLRLLHAALRSGAEVIVYGPGWNGASAARQRAQAVSWGRRLQREWQFVCREGAAAWWRRRVRPERPLPPLPPERVKPSLAHEPYLTTTRDCTVCVGINRYPSFRHDPEHPDTYSRLRDIEAPMLGACYLTEWAEGLDELYEPGREIEVYRSADDLADQLARLRRDHAHRRTLRRAGQVRALSEHSIPRTIARLTHAIGLS